MSMSPSKPSSRSRRYALSAASSKRCASRTGMVSTAPGRSLALSLTRRPPKPRPDLRHAAQPAVAVLGLALHVGVDRFVREDQEAFLVHRPDDALGDLFRLQHPVDESRAGAARGHAGMHTLGAQHGDPDAFRSVFRGQELGDPDGGVLAHRIGHAVDLKQDAGGGHGVDQIALAAFGHARRDGPRGVDMRHRVDAEAVRDVRIGLVLVAGAQDAGVGAEDIDRP